MTRRDGFRACAALSVAGLLTLAAAGCGSSTPGTSASLEEATVQGTVRVRGKAVTNGMISFRCSNINRPNEPLREATISKDGTYTIKTLVGQNFVSVSCKELFTPQNRQFVENELPFDVKSGENTHDIDIGPAAPGAPPK